MDAPDSPLPPLYAAWMEELLGEPVRGEPRSTCFSCAMVATGPEHEDPGPHFLPDLKCCMFSPKLPNFLVGRALCEDGPGRASVERRVADPAQRGPLGLSTPMALTAAHEAARAAGRFGLDTALRCPHFIVEGGGLCGIWSNRESICATWYCRHERGAVSRQRWSALQRLLAAVEDALSREIARQLGAGPRDWGDWRGREEAFYRAAAARAAALSWRDVSRIGGFELRFRARHLKETHAALSATGLPDTLVLGPARVAPLPDGRQRVFAYSEYDPEDLAAELVARLAALSGRPVAELLDPEPAGTDAPPLDEGTLQRLFDLRVLDRPPDA